MYIKEEMVHDKQTGELIGFTNLGAINQQIVEFEQSVISSDSHTVTLPTVLESQLPLAKTMLRMMVIGLLTNLLFPCVQSTYGTLKSTQT